MFSIAQVATKTVTQLALCLAVALLLPLLVRYGITRSAPPPDSRWLNQEIAAIHQKIADTDDQAEKAYQTREIAILEKRHTEQLQRYRHLFWLAHPIGLLALVFGLVGITRADTVRETKLLSPMQRAEELDRREFLPGRPILRTTFFAIPFPFDFAVIPFAYLHRVRPFAWGLVLGGLMTIAMASFV